MNELPPTPDPNPNSSEFEDAKRNWREQRQRFNSHPTNIPIIFSAIWFFVLLISNFLFSFSKNFENKDFFNNLVLFPTLFGMGLSGLLMLILGESVSKQGKLYRGFCVYLLGVILIVFGWGAIIAMVYY